jgi:hypothetical protein
MDTDSGITHCQQNITSICGAVQHLVLYSNAATTAIVDLSDQSIVLGVESDTCEGLCSDVCNKLMQSGPQFIMFPGRSIRVPRSGTMSQLNWPMQNTCFSISTFLVTAMQGQGRGL